MANENSINGKLIDVHVKEVDSIPPIDIWNAHPLTPEGKQTTLNARRGIESILKGEDDRKLLIVGPCSIHDKNAAYHYAEGLIGLAETVSKRILIIQRMYFEKPRTISRPTMEWEGLINDPHGDGRSIPNEGYMLAREIAAHVVNSGMPIATEFLDTFTPRYLDGTIAWAAIGARTIESQVHRHMAAGLSNPVGYKNSTSGNELRAIEAFITAFYPGHIFQGIGKDGKSKFEHNTNGNPYGHIVLRGGDRGPNYDADNVDRVQKMMLKNPAYQELGMPPNVLIDCSHANANKDYKRQPIVFENVLGQIVGGNQYVNGWMLESHIEEGNQRLPVPLKGFANSGLKYGVSVTDPCIGWKTTYDLIMDAYRTLSRINVTVLRRA